MKRIATLALTIAALATPAAEAALIDRGNGLIYDSSQDITWLQDADLSRTSMTWADALSWASQLVYQGFDDWRLPTTLVPDPSCPGVDFGPAVGVAPIGTGCTGSEMGHLYGIDGITAATPGPFLSVGPYAWSSTPAPSADALQRTYAFRFSDGIQNNIWTGNSLGTTGTDVRPWAVRDGDVRANPSVPAPASLALLGIPLLWLLQRHRSTRAARRS